MSQFFTYLDDRGGFVGAVAAVRIAERVCLNAKEGKQEGSLLAETEPEVVIAGRGRNAPGELLEAGKGGDVLDGVGLDIKAVVAVGAGADVLEGGGVECATALEAKEAGLAWGGG